MDLRSAFVKRFGDLVALLRVDPGNDAAQDLALTAAAAAVADHAIVVESGVERGLEGNDLSLPGRLRARHIDLMRVSAGAPPDELLRVARALSHDAIPVPSTRTIRMEMVPNVVPAGLALVGSGAEFNPARGENDRRSWRERRKWRVEPWRGVERRRADDRRVTGERRLRLIKHNEADVSRLQDRATRAVAAGAWLEALEAAHDLMDHAGRVPGGERRSFVIGLRRYVPRRAVEGFIQLGLRDPAEQGRVADVLRVSGLEGADVMVDAIRGSSTAGPRKFIHRVLGEMPDAYPAVLPLLNGSEPHEIRYAAGILGRMKRPEALPLLKRHLGHGDASVRRAVLLALAAFPATDTADGFAGALAHPVPDTRAAAAEAIGLAHATAMAMPVVAALGVERDAPAWSAMVNALGLLASAESCAALAAVALARRRLIGRGYSADRRLEAVRALASVAAPSRQPALERVAREGDGAVRSAAVAALAQTARAAG